MTDCTHGLKETTIECNSCEEENKSMKLIPFDLEKALVGEKVITREGIEVKNLTLFEGCGIYSLAGILEESLISWTSEGIYSKGDINENDLFMAPKEPVKKEGWKAIINEKNGLVYENSIIFESKQEALDFFSNRENQKLIGLKKIEWEE